MQNHLFDNFDAVSSKQWKQQIQFELKGADFNDTLVWNSPEDIQVKPFYHNDGAANFLSANTNTTQFKIGEHIFVHNVEKSIRKANEVLSRGAESLQFTIENELTDIQKLLNGINVDGIAVHFKLNFLSEDFIANVAAVGSQKNFQIYYNLDPIGFLAKDGNWFKTAEESNLHTLKSISDNNNLGGTIAVNVGLYQNAGANIVQQLAYAMAQASEYFHNITDIRQQIVFEVAVGTNYFFEIAKLRALRILFRSVAAEFNHKLDCHIIATPTKRNKTIYDYNTNMLRSTTECMSAILGGADTIINMPYDSLYHKNNEFGDRIARNQLLILKKESYFDKVDNPSDGSYYIESITKQLAEKALTLFKDIEQNGGFLKQLMDGTIKRKTQESANLEQRLFDSGKEILLGTNKHPNPADRMKDNLELFPFVKIKPRKTLIQPIIEKRLAEKSEQERLKLEL